MKMILSSKKEQNMRVYEVPTSALMIGTHRINYYKLMTSLEYSGCNEALKRMSLEFIWMKSMPLSSKRNR